MFIIVNSDNNDCFQHESFEVTKKEALKMKEELGENFRIIEEKEVWTTQTLEEAINSK